MAKGLHKKRFFAVLLLFGFLIASSASILVDVEKAHAITGQGNNIGWITGRNMYYTDTPTPDRRVIPRGLYNDSGIGVRNVAQLIRSLQLSHGAGGQNTTGAAFVVRTMLGLGAGRDVSTAQWTDLTQRLDALQAQGKITWNAWIDKTGTTYGSDKYTGYFDGDYYGYTDYDVAEHSDWPQTGAGVYIDVGSGKSYSLLYFCANPSGDAVPLPVTPPWCLLPSGTKLYGNPNDASCTPGPKQPDPDPPTFDNPNPYNSGVATVADRSVAVPGETITWKHVIRNSGPNKTHVDITYHYQNRQDLGAGTGPNKILPKDTPVGGGDIFTSTHVVTASDLTKTLCRSTSASPKSSIDNGWIESNQACVTVPYNYTLTPTASLASNRVIEGSATAKVDIGVQNAGPTQSKPTQWRVTKIIVQQGGSVPNSAGGTSVAAALPCGTYFSNAKAVCSTVPGASGTSVFGVGGSIISGDQLPQQSVPIGDLPIGTKICFALSVQAESSSSDQWRHSAPSCITIGKKPKIQVLGEDLSVGKAFSGVTGALPLANIYTSTSVKDISGVQRTFGSWTEYGIFATGRVGASTSGSIASGSAYGGNPTGLENATLCNTSTLSFTNAATTTGCNATTVIGGYATTRTIPDVASTFPVTSSTPVLTTNDLANAAVKGVYTAPGDLTLSGGTIGVSRWVVLNAPNSTVTINGNILYTPATLTSASQIPQVIIIAKNIVIADSVTQIDAWLIAKSSSITTDGVINTCGTVGGTALSTTEPLTAGICSNQLVVNGPVMANKLFLRRTAGSGTGANSGDPAEIFNLRPDAYIWAAARSQSGGRIQTVYSTELPPRL